MKEERWKPVVGMEPLYEVSDVGRVRSKHATGRPTKSPEHVLAQQSNRKGYRRVALHAAGRGYTVVVHRLILEAFVGLQPSAIHQANHKNGIKWDNRLSNLEWVTPVENNRHAVRNGWWHPHIGEAHGRAKLTEEQVLVIRTLQGQVSAELVGKRFGVSNTAIRLIWKRRNWKHLVG